MSFDSELVRIPGWDELSGLLVPGVTARLDGHSVVITGGTGSFGRSMATVLVESGLPSEVVLIARNEGRHFEVMDALGGRMVKLKSVIADVRDRGALRGVIPTEAIVFHAAAMKQVPLCESFIMEAVRTNVLGTVNVLEEATEAKVVRFVGIATDKCVDPINTYGLTKALLERLVTQAALAGLPAHCVRYGNVLGSRGSVVPFFLRQIQCGGLVTVTDAEMTRFMLPMRDALAFVLNSLVWVEVTGAGGVFVPSLSSMRIPLLARMMAGARCRIVYIGRRPGEKIHELMVSANELHRAYRGQSYLVILPEGGCDAALERLGSAYSSDQHLNDDEEYWRQMLKREGVPLAESGFAECK